MKKLNKFRASYQNGKEIKKEHIRVCKVIDCVADNLVIDTPVLIKETKSIKNGKIVTIDVWEEFKAPAKVGRKPKETIK